MKKLLFEGSLIILVFIISWVVLRQVNWVSIFKVDEISKTTEEKLGDLSWEFISSTEVLVNDKQITAPVDSLLSKICEANDIDRKKIKLHIIEKDEINAFALPDDHLVIYTGLIRFCDNESELSGVIGHELAHLELDHVMKKLIKEIGLSAIISITTGSSGGATIKEIAKMLSSSAFDRNLEKAADLKSVDYLVKAGINPEDFAEFLFKVAQKQPEFIKNISWISSHPESVERSEYVIEYSLDKKREFKNILADHTWEEMKTVLGEVE